MADPTEPTERELAAYHEAGHAVAGVMHGSVLISAELGENHGTGITFARREVWEDRFFTWAGPWAEARFTWPNGRDLSSPDEDDVYFTDYVSGVLLAQPSDLSTVVDHERRIRATPFPGGRDHDELFEADYRVWSNELNSVWPAIEWVAQSLLEGRPIADADVRIATEVATYAYLHWKP